jgi:hypothetical protein
MLRPLAAERIVYQDHVGRSTRGLHNHFCLASVLASPETGPGIEKQLDQFGFIVFARLEDGKRYQRVRRRLILGASSYDFGAHCLWNENSAEKQ